MRVSAEPRNKINIYSLYTGKFGKIRQLRKQAEISHHSPIHHHGQDEAVLKPVAYKEHIIPPALEISPFFLR